MHSGAPRAGRNSVVTEKKVRDPLFGEHLEVNVGSLTLDVKSVGGKGAGYSKGGAQETHVFRAHSGNSLITRQPGGVPRTWRRTVRNQKTRPAAGWTYR